MDISRLMFREGLLAGERILVTGGGTGLGREMAEAFLKLGAEVHICGRRQNRLDETAAELAERHGGTITGHGCDIRDPNAISDMAEEAQSLSNQAYRYDQPRAAFYEHPNHHPVSYTHLTLPTKA